MLIKTKVAGRKSLVFFPEGEGKVQKKTVVEDVKQPVMTETTDSTDINYSEYLKEHGVPIEGDTDYHQYLSEHGVTEKPNAARSYLRSKEFREAMGAALALSAISIANPFASVMYKAILKVMKEHPELAKKTGAGSFLGSILKNNIPFGGLGGISLLQPINSWDFKHGEKT